ncbi:pirin family protein [Oscillatoria sp. HE19RPO]|uniref:pirin family protein n=1 Tax=Oscillatoria sp. HE19RPO TaxID=2954806 RepID=UPI0020C5566E|nr:pirin family protein [Oscillatoria sp. HE19RPO]
MLTLRKAEERGQGNYGWLKTSYSFSFANYYDPQYMGFRALRVINQDWVSGGGGFPTHSHRDMEIVTYILQGALEHKDSMGNSSVILPGEVQRMSAGTGVAHSEFNPSPTESVHLLQIWMLPGQQGLPPSYEQKHYSEAEKRGKLRLIGSSDGREGSVTIHQDLNLYATILHQGDRVVYDIPPNRHAWIQVARGTLTLNDLPLKTGDGVACSAPETLTLVGSEEEAEVLLFDLA